MDINNPIPLPQEYPVPDDLHSNLRSKLLNALKSNLPE